ncbi:MAG: hypothetical protein AAB074_10395 [Planctomycetota bacterium]
MRTAAIFILAALSAAADTRIERTTTWESSRPGLRAERTNRREILWIGEGRVRCDDRVSRESWIVRADKKVIWRIDHALRTWSEVTFEEAIKARESAVADLKAALARVAGSGDEVELRRFMECLAPSAGACEVKETGDGGTVAGKTTRALLLEPKGGPGVKGRLASEAAGLDRLAKALGEAGLLAPGVAAALEKSKGMLLSGSWTLVFPDAIVRESFEATKVEEAAAPEGAYDLPAGYRKVAARPMGRAPRAEAAPPGGYAGDAPGSEPEPGEGPTGEEAGKEQ